MRLLLQVLLCSFYQCLPFPPPFYNTPERLNGLQPKEAPANRKMLVKHTKHNGSSKEPKTNKQNTTTEVI